MRISLFFLFIISYLTGSAQEAESIILENTPAEYSRAALNIKGDVTALIEKHFSIGKDGKLASRPSLTVTYTFDKQGRIATKEVANRKRIKYSFTYDHAGRPTEVILSGDSSTTHKFQYSQTSNVVTKTYLHKSAFTETMETDGRGKLNKWIIDRGANAGYSYKYVYEYQPDGSIKSIRADDGGRNDWDMNFSYRFGYGGGGDVLSRTGYCMVCEEVEIESSYYYQTALNNWVTRIEEIKHPLDPDENSKNVITREYTYSQKSTSYPLIQPETFVYLQHELSKIAESYIPFKLVSGNRKVEKISFLRAWANEFSFDMDLIENGKANMYTKFVFNRELIKDIKVTDETADYYELTFYYNAKIQANIYSRWKPDGTPETSLEATDTGVLYLSKKADVNAVIKAFESLKID